MTTVFFETKVVLDLLMDRASFSDDAIALFDAVATGEVAGLLGRDSVAVQIIHDGGR